MRPKRSPFLWTSSLLLATGLAGFAAWRRAMARNPVALLDRADRLLRGGERRLRTAASVRFGPDPAQKLALFVPATPAAQPLPIVIFFHGGGWAEGDPADYRFIARSLVPHGFAVVLAGYRLGKAGRYPAMLEDGAMALRWVVDHAADHGADPSRIALIGHSAGAYNAVMLGLDPRWLAAVGLDADQLRGIVGLAGPYDFLPLDDPVTLATFAQWDDLAETQPLAHVREQGPPLLLLHGKADSRVRPRHSTALASHVERAGGRHELHLVEGLSHEGLIMRFARPFTRDRRTLDLVLGFLDRVLQPAFSAGSSPPDTMSLP